MTEPALVAEATEDRADSLRLTERAVEMLKTTLRRQRVAGHGLRVSVVGGGCSGLQYHLELQEAPAPGDTVLQRDGVRIFVDEASRRHLDGVTLDYVTGLHGAGFKFLPTSLGAKPAFIGPTHRH